MSLLALLEDEPEPDSAAEVAYEQARENLGHDPACPACGGYGAVAAHPDDPYCDHLIPCPAQGA